MTEAEKEVAKQSRKLMLALAALCAVSGAFGAAIGISDIVWLDFVLGAGCGLVALGFIMNS